jgi:hypothetical protein
MIMNNRLLKSLCALLMCCAVMALASPGLAQERRGFGVRVQFGPDVERLVRQAENRTTQLTAMLDRRGHEGLSARARDLESQLNMVGGEFAPEARYDRRSQVASVLRVAESINTAMRYRRVDFDVQRQWSMVRNDLNRLARVYNLRQLY